MAQPSKSADNTPPVNEASLGKARVWEEPKVVNKTIPIPVPAQMKVSPGSTGAFIARASQKGTNPPAEPPASEEPSSHEKLSPPSNVAKQDKPSVEVRPSGHHRVAARWQVGRSNILHESQDTATPSQPTSLNSSQSTMTPAGMSPATPLLLASSPALARPKQLFSSSDRLGTSGSNSGTVTPGTSVPGPTTATVSLRGLRPPRSPAAAKSSSRSTYDPDSTPKDTSPIFPLPAAIAQAALELPATNITILEANALSTPTTPLSPGSASLTTSSESWSGNTSGDRNYHSHHHRHHHHHHHHHHGHHSANHIPSDTPPASSASSVVSGMAPASPPKSPGPHIVPAFRRPISPNVVSPPSSRPLSPPVERSIPASTSNEQPISNTGTGSPSPIRGVSPRPPFLVHSATAPELRPTSPEKYRWEVASPPRSPPRQTTSTHAPLLHSRTMVPHSASDDTTSARRLHNQASSPPQPHSSAAALLSRVSTTELSNSASLASSQNLRTSGAGNTASYGVLSPPLSPRSAAVGVPLSSSTSQMLNWSSSSNSLLGASFQSTGGTMTLRHSPLIGVSLSKIPSLATLKTFFIGITEWLEDKLVALPDGEREEPFEVAPSDCPDTLRAIFAKDWVDADILFPEMKLPSVLALLKRFFHECPDSIVSVDTCEKIISHGELNHTVFRGTFMQGLVMSLAPSARTIILTMVPFLSRLVPRMKLTLGMSPIEILANAFGSGIVHVSPQQYQQNPELLSIGNRALQALLHNVDLWLPERETDWIETKDGQLMVVAAARTSSLPALLMAPQYRDVELSDLVIALHAQYFQDAMGLLDRFCELYQMSTEERNPEWRNSIQLRLLVLIYTWIKSARSQQPKSVDCIREKLSSWLRGLSPSPDSAKNMQQMTLGLLGNERVSEDQAHSPKGLTLNSIPKIMRTDFSILDVPHADVAIVMTLIDFELYRQIPNEEFLTRAFMKEAKSPHWHEMVGQWNRITHLVQHEILRKEGSSAIRANLIHKWVLVIEACIKLNNFSAASAILGGLNAAPISRLASSWEKVPSKVRKLFKDLMRIFDHSQNYRTYRELIATLYPPFIPYLALFGKWLFAIEENNVTFLTDRHDVVNVSKLRNIWKLLRELRRSRTGEYRISYDALSDLAIWIRNASIPSNEDLFYEQSLRCEPQRKTVA